MGLLHLRWIALLALFLFISGDLLYADVGIIVYESKGVDARRTANGHVAIIATDLCAEGISQVRACRPGETPGVVITHYANLAYGYDKTIFVAPLLDHFTATADPELVPALSSGGTLEAMQIEYWREHLRPYLPPFSQEQYEQLREQVEKFDMGRAFRRLINMETLIGLLAPQKKKYPTEPIALIDPITKELIPNGRWREVIGAAHMRTSIVITMPTSAEQERRLIPYIEAVHRSQFQILKSNCSDFVQRGLVEVFADSGFGLRPRIVNVANAWITSPIQVATDVLKYAKREGKPVSVAVVHMMPGTRRPSVPVSSISRGALVPNFAQGKLATSMKIYFNTLNPLLGVISYSVDKLSGFVDLQRVVHERGGSELSRLANQLSPTAALTEDDRKARRREQVRVFGSPACWKAKQEQFSQLVAQAREVGLLSAAERSLILKSGRPFLLARLYERTAARLGQEGMLTAGMTRGALLSAEMRSNFLPSSAATDATSEAPNAAVPGRPEILRMAASDREEERVLAFKLITAVTNFGLSSEPVRRQTAEAFDEDWKLFLHVGRENGLLIPDKGPLNEALEACSCREFEGGKTTRDAYAAAQSDLGALARKGREVAFGANR